MVPWEEFEPILFREALSSDEKLPRRRVRPAWACCHYCLVHLKEWCTNDAIAEESGQETHNAVLDQALKQGFCPQLGSLSGLGVLLVKKNALVVLQEDESNSHGIRRQYAEPQQCDPWVECRNQQADAAAPLSLKERLHSTSSVKVNFPSGGAEVTHCVTN